MTLHQKDGDDYAGGTRRPTAVAHAQHDIAPGVVLILGGSSTLGLAAGRALLAAGHPVALTTRNAEGTGCILAALAPGEAGIPGGGTDFSGNGQQHARLLCPPLSPRACSNSCPWSR